MGAGWGEWAALTAETLGQRWLTRGCPPLRNVAPGGADLQGRTAVVTGPTSGIGTATACELMRRGCHVILACRSVERGERTRAALEAELRGAGDGGAPAPSSEVMELDVGELASVRAFASNVEERGLRVDYLVNNAGVYLLGERTRRTTRDGREAHLATNFLGPCLLTLLLLPALARASAKGARIVNVSSKLHEFGTVTADWSDPGLEAPGAYSPFQAYANSKLAQLLFGAELRRRLQAAGAGGVAGLQVLAVHPGMVITGVANTLPHWMQWAYRNFMQVCLLVPEEGARATVHACCAPDAGDKSAETGGYFTFNAEARAPAAAALDPGGARGVWAWALEELGGEAGLPAPVRALLGAAD